MEATKNPTAPVTAPAPEEVKVPKGLDAVEFWPTAEKATQVAKDRVKGARTPVEIVKPDGSKLFATGGHLHHTGMKILLDQGYKFQEIGKTARAHGGGGGAKPIDSHKGALEALAASGLPEADKKLIMDQIQAMIDKSAKAPEAPPAAKAGKK